MADSALTTTRSTLRRQIASLAGDSLYRNSSFLLFNSLIVSAFGFLFWTLGAHYFSADAVGTTTTVIAGVTYAGMVGTLGLPNAMIRFLAGAPDPGRLIATAGASAAAAGALVGAAWLLVPGHLGFPLDDVVPHWTGLPIVTAVVALASLGAVLESAIIARRESKWVVVENGAASVVKLVAMPLAVGFGAAGLFGLFAASLVASTITSVVLLGRILGSSPTRWYTGLDVGELRRVRTFAAGNHLAALVSMLPGTVVRIVVLASLGSTEAGHLAMPLLIIGLLKFIPSTAAQSLFAEASADEASLGRQARRALRAIYIVLVPSILLLVVAARPVLSVFGRDYADAGTTALRLLALSGVFAGFNYVADTVLNARRDMAQYVFVNVVGSVSAIAGPVLLVGHGLAGVGLGWLLGQAGYAVVAGATLWWRVGRRTAEVAAVERDHDGDRPHCVSGRRGVDLVGVRRAVGRRRVTAAARW